MTIYVRGIGAISTEEWKAARLDRFSRLDTPTGELYMTGLPGADLYYPARERAESFDLRIDLYAGGEGIKAERLIFTPLGDSDIRSWLPREFAELRQALDAAVWALDRDKRVVINCQAGLNRSGLLCALVLMTYGKLGQDAISHIRDRRHQWCLCNASFVRWIDYDAADWLALDSKV